MNFWGIYSLFYDSLNKLIPYKEMLKEAEKELNLSNGDDILDAGCGTGNMCLLLSQKSNVKIIGIDSNDFMLERAIKKLITKKNVHIKKVDLNKPLIFENNVFDKIVTLNVLYALDKPLNTLNEFNRILKPNGTMVIVNPPYKTQNTNIFWEHCRKSSNKLANILLFFQLIVVQVFNIIIVGKGKKRIYHFLNKNELFELLKSANFIDIKIETTYSEQGYLAKCKKGDI